MSIRMQHEDTSIKPPFTPAPIGRLQRKCACGNDTVAGGLCSECASEKQKLQRRAISKNEVSEIPPVVHSVLRSTGRSLDAETQGFMEPRFGQDFSRVRVHTDTKAAESAREVNALACKVGKNVVFGAGQYEPSTVTEQQSA